MAKPNRQAAQDRRQRKGDSMKGRNNTPVTREYKSDIFAQERRKTCKIEPLNERQEDYLAALYEDECHTLLVSGVLGSSKTYLPSALAADFLMEKRIKKVVIARPAEGKGKSVGFTKGDFNEKLMGWCAPVVDTMKERMGLGEFTAALEYEKIILLPLEQVKGRSWDDAWIIVDEAEDMDADVAKSLVTRQGMRSKTIITGDFAQKDLRSYSGLDMLVKVADYCNLPIARIDFDSWDYCVRSEEAKMWGMAFQEYEQSHKYNKQ